MHVNFNLWPGYSLGGIGEKFRWITKLNNATSVGRISRKCKNTRQTDDLRATHMTSDLENINRADRRAVPKNKKKTQRERNMEDQR